MGQPRSRFGHLLAWGLLVGVGVVTAIALISSHFGWPLYLELLSHFQRQYWGLSVLGMGTIGLTRRRLPFCLSLLCVTALTAQLLPWYLPPHFVAASEPGNYRILIANVNRQNRDFEAVLQWAQQTNPDLALFMEVDARWVEQLSPLQAELPHMAGQDRDDNFGLVLYSRYPLTTAEMVNFAADSMPSIVATTTVQGESLAIVGTHPLPPVNRQYFQSRNRQLEQLGQYLQTVELPQVVIGDFNITMWSPYYRRWQQQTGLKNVRHGFGILPSWPSAESFPPLPSWLTPWLAIPIDHGLVSPELTVGRVQIGPDIGSDHRPVVLDLMI